MGRRGDGSRLFLQTYTKDAAKHAFNKPRGKGKRQDCDARLRVISDGGKTAIKNHDNLATRRFTRDLKKLARQIKLDKIIIELKDDKWDPVKMLKRIHTQTYQIKRRTR